MLMYCFCQTAEVCSQIHWDVLDGDSGSWSRSLRSPQYYCLCSCWQRPYIIFGLWSTYNCKPHSSLHQVALCRLNEGKNRLAPFVARRQ